MKARILRYHEAVLNDKPMSLRRAKSVDISQAMREVDLKRIGSSDRLPDAHNTTMRPSTPRIRYGSGRRLTDIDSIDVDDERVLVLFLYLIVTMLFQVDFLLFLALRLYSMEEGEGSISVVTCSSRPYPQSFFLQCKPPYFNT